MIEDIRWLSIGKEDLLDFLLGESLPSGSSSASPSLQMRRGLIAVGYTGDGASALQQGPALLVLDDDVAVETMSWLRAFSEEAFPMSQFSRVVTHSDWLLFSSSKESRGTGEFHFRRWASVAVGEVLALAESDVDLTHMPLSRLAASLTLPVGRSSHLYGSEEATLHCVDRLRTVSNDARFARRPLSVSQLSPIWALCSAEVGTPPEPRDAALLVAEVAGSYFRDDLSSGSMDAGAFLGRYSGLTSDSAEQRVITFKEFTSEVLHLPTAQIASFGAVLLATGAFMVGRSTSHAFLLNRFRKTAPAALVWFGLIAALAGPRSWDGAWLRAVKGAERLLKPKFSWTDTSPADISWAEFAWLAGSLNNVDLLLDLPKMLPRTLGVEVVPGVSLQVRLGHGGNADDSRAEPEASARERALEMALNQIVEVAVQARGNGRKVDQPSDARYSSRRQQPLDLGDRDTESLVKANRSRRAKRDI